MIKNLIEPKLQIPEERKQFSDRELTALASGGAVIASQYIGSLGRWSRRFLRRE